MVAFTPLMCGETGNMGLNWFAPHAQGILPTKQHNAMHALYQRILLFFLLSIQKNAYGIIFAVEQTRVNYCRPAFPSSKQKTERQQRQENQPWSTGLTEYTQISQP